MDYKNKYNEALERAREWYAANTNEGYRGIFEEIFPELKESEDDKIRKEILDYIIKGSESYYDIQQYGRGKFGKWITWLEKQGEQKHVWSEEDENKFKIVINALIEDYEATPELINWFKSIKDRIQSKQSNKPQGKTALEVIKEEKIDNANKVEPKFHEGDWCIDNEDGIIFQIVKVLDNTYNYRTNEGEEYSCTHYSLEDDVRLWTISDAKEGDVLISSINKPFIYNGYFDEGSVGAYCGLYINDDFVKADKERYWTNNENIRPSTKEQRDFFFSKMKDAGYKWDSEQKQLITLDHFEDKDDMVEPKFKVGDIVQYITDSTDRRKIEEVDTSCNMYHTDSSPIMFEIEDEWKVVVNAEDVEQNPTDKIETKFKVGEWIIQENIGVYEVTEICESWYEVIDTENKHYSIGFDKEFMCHLWSIEDAKDGDVLMSSVNKPFIYNGYFDKECVGAYCGLYINDDFVIADKELYWTNNKNIRPASKEQRDLIFQKMKENGYENVKQIL